MFRCEETEQNIIIYTWNICKENMYYWTTNRNGSPVTSSTFLYRSLCLKRRTKVTRQNPDRRLSYRLPSGELPAISDRFPKDVDGLSRKEQVVQKVSLIWVRCTWKFFRELVVRPVRMHDWDWVGVVRRSINRYNRYFNEYVVQILNWTFVYE